MVKRSFSKLGGDLVVERSFRKLGGDLVVERSASKLSGDLIQYIWNLVYTCMDVHLQFPNRPSFPFTKSTSAEISRTFSTLEVSVPSF